MKKIVRFWRAGLFISLLVALAGNACAQTTSSTSIPLVTIQATQPIASSPGSPGIFTVFRAGNTNETLNVFYQVGGSANNGLDYTQIPNSIEIAAGAVSNNIVITPLANPAPDSAAKTVMLQLGPSPFLNPVNYEIGVPSNAVVYLTGSGTHLPPVVNIINPANGSTFYLPTNILLEAQANDPDGNVTNVEFFAGTNDLGPGTPVVLDPPGINGVTGLIYILTWSNPSSGNYSLTAVATDNGGASTVSPAVNISVLTGSPTNPPPVVRIVSPASGSVFRAPIDLPLLAYVNYPTDSTASVEFYDGTNDLGPGQPEISPTPVPLAGSNGAPITSPVPPIYPANLFVLIWTNAPIGNHILTAQATIFFITHPLVLLASSAPVDITILPPLPPPTNRPAIVNIVATDPVAIEGTNCWVWPGESNSPATWAAWPAAVCQYYTNYGPKTATFTIRRLGETNDNLTVTYDIGGTASNGVDYVALPGFVTIPATERAALITVVPIDDGPPDIDKTVILSLTPSTNMPLDYLVGYPPRAAAIIVDRPHPWPASTALPDRCFHLSIPGPDAAWFSVEYSTNLTDWTPICTNQVINGSIDFIDPDACANVSRFYRAVAVTNGPTD